MDVVSSTPTARKRHWCEVCPDPIEPGNTYSRVVTFDGGDVLTWKAHPECQDATSQARASDYGDGDGLITGEAVVEWAEEFRGLYDAAAMICDRYRKMNLQE